LGLLLFSIGVSVDAITNSYDREPYNWAQYQWQMEITNTAFGPGFQGPMAVRRINDGGKYWSVAFTVAKDGKYYLLFNYYPELTSFNDIRFMLTVWTEKDNKQYQQVLVVNGTKGDCGLPGKRCGWFLDGSHPNRYLFGPLTGADVFGLTRGHYLKFRYMLDDGQYTVVSVPLNGSWKAIDHARRLAPVFAAPKNEHEY